MIKARPSVKFDYSISIIRVVAMVMIVLYHSFLFDVVGDSQFKPAYGHLGISLNTFMVYLALDAFVFISGVLYYRIGSATNKYDNKLNFLCTKASRLLVPFLVWGLAMCLMGLGDFMELIYEPFHLWFLMMLFWVFAFFNSTKGLWGKLELCGSMILFLSLVFLDSICARLNVIPKYTNGTSLLCLQLALDYLPIFLMGIMTERFSLHHSSLFTGFKGFLLLVVMLFFGIVSDYIPIRKLYSLWGWIPKVFVILVVYSWLSRNFVIGGRERHNVLLFLDHYSMSIYLIYMVLILLYEQYIAGAKTFLNVHYYLAPLLLFIIVFALSVILSYLLSALPFSKYIIGTTKYRTKSLNKV